MDSLSTLAKIMVVLLSLAAIFLGGVMVSYVGSANNFKKQYESEKSAREAIQAENISLTDRYTEQVEKTKELAAEKDGIIQSLQDRLNQTETALKQVELLKQEYESRADSWKGVMTGLEQSVDSMLESLKLTRQQLETARSQNIQIQKELDQKTASLYEKLVELQRLEAERRRILEQKTDLEKHVSQIAGGTTAPAVSAVTQVPSQAKPAAVVTSAEINGLITEISESLVTLSVGSADGVEKGMVFHITRGSEFLCDVLVTDVDINKSAGVLEMVQQRPQTGDTASTKL